MCHTVRPSEFPSQKRLRSLIAARCCKSATLHTRSADAAHNELATGIQAAEDVIDPRDVPPSAKCAALAFAAIDRAMHLPPLVALGPDSTDRTAAFRSAQGGAA